MFEFSYASKFVRIVVHYIEKILIFAWMTSHETSNLYFFVLTSYTSWFPTKQKISHPFLVTHNPIIIIPSSTCASFSRRKQLRKQIKAHLLHRTGGNCLTFSFFLSTTQPCTRPVRTFDRDLLSEMNDFNYTTKLFKKRISFFCNLIIASPIVMSLN